MVFPPGDTRNKVFFFDIRDFDELRRHRLRVEIIRKADKRQRAGVFCAYDLPGLDSIAATQADAGGAIRRKFC